MKVLFTVENYYPKMSGVPNVVKYLAENFAKKGHNVTIVTRAVEGCPDEEILNYVKIIRKNINYTATKRFSGDTVDYIDFVTNFDCDAIIFECSQCITTDLILPYLKKIKCKKIFHSHGFSGLTLKPFKKASSIRGTLGNSYNWIKWKWYYNNKFKRYISDFDVALCLSEIDSSKEYLDKYANKVAVLSNAADDMFFADKFENPIWKYTQLESEKYLISVANYQEYKNQIGILDQFASSCVEGYDLVFVGSKQNRYYNSLLRHYNSLRKNGLNKKVHFLFGVERNDVPGLIKNASLYLVGSTFEEFSISLIEAMALGVPFISTNVGNAKFLPGGITISRFSQLSIEMNNMLFGNKKYLEMCVKGKQYANSSCRIEVVANKLLDIIQH